MTRSAEHDLKKALDVIAQHEDIMGCRPFADLSSGHASDRCANRLGEAKAILLVLSAAFQDTAQMMRESLSPEMNHVPSEILGRALDGVSSLLDLSSMALYADHSPRNYEACVSKRPPQPEQASRAGDGVKDAQSGQC